jgi:4-amino-4-deoxy-L-arabinose transferase-like glycosyltransferase
MAAAAGTARRRPIPRPRVALPALPRTAWVLLLVALVLRVGLVVATVDTPLTLDPADFSGNGVSFAQGHGLPPSNRAPAGGPSAYRPPAYPVFLGGVYALVGQEAPPAARLLEAGLGALSVGLIGLIAARLWGRRVGVLALGIAAVAPPLIVMSTALVSEALFVPLMLGAVAAAIEARRSEHPLRWAAVAGVLLGLCALTRTNAVLLVVPLALAVWWGPGRFRPRALLPPALVVGAMVLTIAPWTIRNALVVHRFVPISSEVGYTLAGTYNQASRADRHWPAVWKEAEHGASPEYEPLVFYASVDRWSEVEFGDRLQDAAIADIRSDPSYMLKVGWWNAVRMFHLGELDFAVANLRDTSIPAGPAWLEIAGFYPLGVLALAGLVTRRARRAPAWLWLVPVCLAATLLVTGFIRFRAGIDPFLVMAAALALAAVAERFRDPAAAV